MTGDRSRQLSLACRICGGEALADAGTVAGYLFLECGDCGFAFAPSVRASGMEALYADGYHGPQDGAPEVGWASTEFLEPALGRLPGDGPLAILDFGCGQSLIPDLLRTAGGHRVVAVDIVPPLRPHPDRLTGRLEDLGLRPRSFDLVYAFQVFEHLPEPRGTFEALLDLVRPGGLLHVHTDMETPERGAGLEGWWYAAPPDHCAFYRHRTFEALLAGSPHHIEWTEPKAVLIRVGRV